MGVGAGVSSGHVFCASVHRRTWPGDLQKKSNPNGASLQLALSVAGPITPTDQRWNVRGLALRSRPSARVSAILSHPRCTKHRGEHAPCVQTLHVSCQENKATVHRFSERKRRDPCLGLLRADCLLLPAENKGEDAKRHRMRLGCCRRL